MRRFGERRACRVHLRPAAFTSDVAAGRPLTADIVEAEVRGDFLPAHALVEAAEYVVSGRIQDPAVVRRKDDRERPGKAVSHGLGCDTGRLLWPDIHELDLPGAMVVTLQRPGAPGAVADRTAINNVRIFGMDGNKAAFTSAGVGAVTEGDRAPDSGTGY